MLIARIFCLSCSASVSKSRPTHQCVCLVYAFFNKWFMLFDRMKVQSFLYCQLNSHACMLYVLQSIFFRFTLGPWWIHLPYLTKGRYIMAENFLFFEGFIFNFQFSTVFMLLWRTWSFEIHLGCKFIHFALSGRVSEYGPADMSD